MNIPQNSSEAKSFIGLLLLRMTSNVITDHSHNNSRNSKNENENVLKNVKDYDMKSFEDYSNEIIVIVDFKSVIVHMNADRGKISRMHVFTGP